MLSWQDVFAAIQQSIKNYAYWYYSNDFLIFAYEMDLFEDGVSHDPALSWAFRAIAGGEIPDIKMALIVAAKFVEAEMVNLRGVELARSLVVDLRTMAAAWPTEDLPNGSQHWSMLQPKAI